MDELPQDEATGVLAGPAAPASGTRAHRAPAVFPPHGGQAGPPVASPAVALGSAAAPDAPPEPRRSRLSLADLAGDGPEELPDVARELRSLRRILELNRRLSRVDDEAALVADLLDGANAIFGSERAFLLAPAGSGRGFLVVASRDLAGGAVAPDGPGVCERIAVACLVRREDVVVANLGRDPRYADAAVPGVRSVLAIPVGGGETLALYLDSRADGEAFALSDAELAHRLAEQAAMSLERVRLLGQVRRQRDELVAAAENAERLNLRLAEILARRTAELREAREDLALAGAGDGMRHRFPEIVGRGPAMTATLRQIDRIADTDVPVLVEGESGTGKELLARALHASSRRAGARFVAENCAALPDTLLENELFGHERGAFTGADAAATGLFERADGGTLFLDEVGDMSPNLQKRLLRVLQEGEVRRVGGSSVRKVDVRILTATNRDLLALVKEGRFREDLYYRLAVVKIRVPPLRERREDVPALVEHCLNRFRGKAPAPPVSDAAMDALVAYDWPGNVRQLENEMRRAAALARGPVELDLLSPELREPKARAEVTASPPVAEGRTLRDLVEDLEVGVLRSTLERERGNITRAAEALGLSRLGLRKKIARYRLTRRGGDAAAPGVPAAPHPAAPPPRSAGAAATRGTPSSPPSAPPSGRSAPPI